MSTEHVSSDEVLEKMGTQKKLIFNITKRQLKFLQNDAEDSMNRIWELRQCFEENGNKKKFI